MKVLLVGDVHGDLNFMKYCLQYAIENGCDQILQLGDFHYYPYYAHGIRFLEGLNSEIPVYWLDGNHEDHSVIAHRARSPLEVAHNIFYLPRGYTWQLGDLKALALGGAYSIDRHRGEKDYDWFEEEVLTDKDVERACQAGEVDIMFTHDCPIGVPIKTILGLHAKEYKDAISNRKALQVVVDAVKPKYLFHGHYHVRYETDLNGCKIIGLHCNDKREQSIYLLDTEQLKMDVFLTTGKWS